MSKLSELLDSVNGMNATSSLQNQSMGKAKPIDSEAHLTHIKNLVNGVYVQTEALFRKVDVDKHSELIKECMHDSEVLSIAAKQGIVNDADAVTILEALKYTSKRVQTGTAPLVRLALIEPSEQTGENPELATKQSCVWNAIVEDNFTEQVYTELFEAAGQGPKKLNVLSISLDTYIIS